MVLWQVRGRLLVVLLRRILWRVLLRRILLLLRIVWRVLLRRILW